MAATTAPQLAATRPASTRHQPIAQTDEQPILSIRAGVPNKDAERFIADALHDIRVFMQEHDLTPAGPPFAICRPRRDDLDIEAGWPTATKPLSGTSRIHSGLLPRSLTGPRARPSMGDAAERRIYVLEV